MTYTFTRGGFISFQSRISSEPNYDNGYFFIDDQEKFKRSGDGSWITDTYEITPGTHTFRWSYSKDNKYSRHSDCLFVDNIIKEEKPTTADETYTFIYGQTCEVIAVPEENHFFVNLSAKAITVHLPVITQHNNCKLSPSVRGWVRKMSMSNMSLVTLGNKHLPAQRMMVAVLLSATI